MKGRFHRGGAAVALPGAAISGLTDRTDPEATSLNTL